MWWPFKRKSPAEKLLEAFLRELPEDTPRRGDSILSDIIAKPLVLAGE